MNIDQLDSRGKVITQWCFAPRGELAVGEHQAGAEGVSGDDGVALASANRRVRCPSC
jgi:hypothetical protein